MRTYKKISVGKLVVVILCALLLLVVSQNLAFNIGLLLTKAGLSAMIGNIMIAMLYVGFTYLGIQLLYKKFLNPWSLIIISCCNHFVYAVCRYV